MDGVPGHLLPDLDQGMTELLGCVRCNLVAQMDWNIEHNVGCSVAFRSGQSMVSISSSSRNWVDTLTIWDQRFPFNRRKPGSTQHQSRVWEWLQRFHPDTQWESKCCHLTCRGLCVPPWICFPRPSLTHHLISHAELCYRQHNVLHGFSRPFNVSNTCSGWTCTHLWKVQSYQLVFYGKSKSGSKVLGSEHRVH